MSLRTKFNSMGSGGIPINTKLNYIFSYSRIYTSGGTTTYESGLLNFIEVQNKELNWWHTGPGSSHVCHKRSGVKFAHHLKENTILFLTTDNKLYTFYRYNTSATEYMDCQYHGVYDIKQIWFERTKDPDNTNNQDRYNFYMLVGNSLIYCVPEYTTTNYTTCDIQLGMTTMDINQAFNISLQTGESSYIRKINKQTGDAGTPETFDYICPCGIIMEDQVDYSITTYKALSDASARCASIYMLPRTNKILPPNLEGITIYPYKYAGSSDKTTNCQAYMYYIFDFAIEDGISNQSLGSGNWYESQTAKLTRTTNYVTFFQNKDPNNLFYFNLSSSSYYEIQRIMIQRNSSDRTKFLIQMPRTL